MELNWIAVTVAAVSSLVLGAVWYAPPLFGKKWMALAGLTEEQAKSGSMPMILGGALALSFAAAAVVSMFLGPEPELGFALGAGASAGAFWVAGGLG
jgi:hypothetical protein